MGLLAEGFNTRVAPTALILDHHNTEDTPTGALHHTRVGGLAAPLGMENGALEHDC